MANGCSSRPAQSRKQETRRSRLSNMVATTLTLLLRQRCKVGCQTGPCAVAETVSWTRWLMLPTTPGFVSP